ncbi:hypothetical protein NIT60_01840 [Mammaliicoccus sciuri]|nr:hypothetical protein NIT60_01840 [Mammaliicoccus sciuri]
MEADLEVYEDFLLYVRTDLRVNEHESEVILMDVLDHLLEASFRMALLQLNFSVMMLKVMLMIY